MKVLLDKYEESSIVHSILENFLKCHVRLCPHLSLLLLAALACSCLTGEEAAPPPAPLLPPGDTALCCPGMLGNPLLGSVLPRAHITTAAVCGRCRVLPGQLLLHGRKRHFWQRSTGVRLAVGGVELVCGDQSGYELVTADCCTLYEVNTHVLPETPSERSVVGAESRLLELALISSLVGEDTFGQ